MRLTKEAYEYIKRSFADGHGLHAKEVQELLDTIDALESELSEARAGCAALLEKVAKQILDEYWKIDVSQREYENGDQPTVIAEALSKMILSLIPTDAAAALAEHADKLRIPLEYRANDFEGKFKNECLLREMDRAALTEEKRKARLAGAFDILSQIRSFRKTHPMDEGFARTFEFIGGLYYQYEAELRAEKGAKP